MKYNFRVDNDEIVFPASDFDGWAETYDASVINDQFPFTGYTRVLERIVELAVPKPGMKVLDLGTGTAQIPIELCRRHGFADVLLLLGYRAPAIHDLAVRVASGKYDLESLKHSSLPTLELRKELMTINGVGPYAAANLLLILGRSDFIPIDSWALKLVSHEWYKGKPITAKEVEKRFEKWGEFKGLAFWFWDWKYKG